MESIYAALGKTNGQVTEKVLEVANAVYPSRGTTKANCAAIAYPIVVGAGGIFHAEGGTVDGRSCYVIRFSDGAWGAVLASDGKGKVWKYEGKGARTEAWARYRHVRKNAAFLPKNGEVVQSKDYNYANAEDALFNLKIGQKSTPIVI